MQNAETLYNLVKAHYTDFATAYKIKDFPVLEDIFAIISIESSWRPDAKSPANAYGLMQITQPALDQVNSIYSTNFTLEDMLRADRNIFVGMRYLRWLYRVFEQLPHAPLFSIIAYNWGIGNVLAWLDGKKRIQDIPLETKDYVLKYLYWKHFWQKKLREEEVKA
jgi:soluble lytic murein transglycosylase-like protein